MKRRAAWGWAAVAGAALCAAAVAPARADLACPQEAQRCLAACSLHDALGPVAGAACRDQCRREAAACLPSGAAASAAPASGSAAPAPADGPVAALPHVGQPLTADEIDAAFRTLAVEAGASPVRPSAPASAPPPQCQRRPKVTFDAQACLEAQLRAQVAAEIPAQGSPDHAARTIRLADAALRLQPVAQSFDGELQALPTAALDRLLQLQTLTAKYAAVGRFLASTRAGAANAQAHARALGPLAPLLAGIDARRRQAVRSAQVDPAVRAAYLQGQVPDNGLELDSTEKAEWEADRQTATLARRLRQELGHPLFMDRTDDIELSGRERTEASRLAGWTEPDRTEIGLALLRYYSAAGARRLGPFEVQQPSPRPDLLAPIDRIVHVEKGSCQAEAQAQAAGAPVPEAAHSAAGSAPGPAPYRCSVRIWGHSFQRGRVLDALASPGNGRVAALFRPARQPAERLDGQPVTLLLRASATGWQLPEWLDAAARRPDAAAQAELRQAELARLQAEEERLQLRRQPIWGRVYYF